MSWAHQADGKVPLFVDRESKRVIKEKISFWRNVEKVVIDTGPFAPLKLFKHGAQSLYSRTKGG